MDCDRFGSSGCRLRRSVLIVIVENGAGLTAGEFARVRITGAGEHDLWGKAV